MVDTESLWRRLTLACFLLGPAFGADENAVEECVEVPDDPRPDCIEAVVLADFVEYRPLPYPGDADTIVMSWTWHVDIDVRDVYVGDIPKGRLTIGATLHGEFNPELRQPVLFLTRKFGGWYLARIEFAARGPDGMVIPVFDEPHPSQLSPEGWWPHDYKRWLEPVAYRWRDVKSFGQRYEDDADDFDPAWVSVGKSRITALRGFKVTEIPAMLAERHAVECAREALR